MALHAGAAAALLIGQRRMIAEELRLFDAAAPRWLRSPSCRRQSSATGSSARSSGAWAVPRATAVGLAAGAVAMALADRRPQLRGPGDAAAVDGLALGLAQAAALAPGVSRNGATLAAARGRRFTRSTPTCSPAPSPCR